jgi:hypothetical protein
VQLDALQRGQGEEALALPVWWVWEEQPEVASSENLEAW